MHYSRVARPPASSGKPVYLIIAGGLVVAAGLTFVSLQGTSWFPSRNTGGTSGQAAGGSEVSAVRPESPDRAFAHKLEENTVKELRAFGTWLEDNDAAGFIGELGWPHGADEAQWNALADRWYAEAASYDLWTTAWAAGSWWGEYSMAIYGQAQDDPSLDAAYSQAGVLEKYLANDFGDRRGVNLAGMEFGEGVSAASPGMPGQDYFYEPESSFAFLASKGIHTIRLPFRWERIQPTLGGPLKMEEITAIRTALDAAQKHKIKVILDLHNYGAYKLTGQRTALLGDGTLTNDHLADVWLKLSREFKGHQAVLGYGIMNEPHDLPKGEHATPAKNWEAASQHVVDALRKHDDKKLVLIAGYDWSSLARWKRNHPNAWIRDPAHNVRYEAHHYWDADGSGQYLRPFAEELAEIQ